MELRSLEYFLAVAREQNITEAANLLHISQPTLSRQIKELEEELGKDLFIRTNRNTYLTDEGVRFRARAEEIVSLAKDTVNDFKDDAYDVTGIIRIGAAETPGMEHIADLFAGLKRQYPGLSIYLFSGNEDDVEEKLSLGLLDFGILMEPVSRQQYEYLYLPQKDRYGVILHSGHPLASRSCLTYKDLPLIPLLIASRSKNALIDLEAWSDHCLRPDELNIAGSYNLIHNAAYFAESGASGILAIDGLIPLSSHPDLAFVPLYPEILVSSLMVWKRSQVFSRAADVFLKEARRYFDTAFNHE